MLKHFRPCTVRAMGPDDYPSHLQFVRWFLQQSNEDIQFPDVVLFTEESQFSREVIQFARTGDANPLVHLCKVISQYLGYYRGQRLAWALHVASSTQTANVQNVLGSSPTEIIGGSTSKDQKENVVSRRWVPPHFAGPAHAILTNIFGNW